MNPQNFSENGNGSERKVRLLRPSVVVLCGPAGCGKSTFADRHFRSTQVISSDWARARISDDDRDQRYNPQAFALVNFIIEQRLNLNRLCVVDSTALTPQSRRDLLALAKRYQVPATLVLFDVPLETCVERDGRRERSVGRTVVERQYQSFVQSKETIRQEGFDQIIDVREGDLDHLQIEVLFRPVARPAQRPSNGENGARKFERTAEPFRPRTAIPGNGLSTPAANPVPAQPPHVAAESWPLAVAVPGAAAPKPVVRPAEAPLMPGHSGTMARPASPVAAHKPLQPVAVAVHKPIPAAEPQGVPLAVEAPAKA